jgi:hypothetical protein
MSLGLAHGVKHTQLLWISSSLEPSFATLLPDLPEPPPADSISTTIQSVAASPHTLIAPLLIRFNHHSPKKESRRGDKLTAATRKAAVSIAAGDSAENPTKCQSIC